MDGEEGVEGDCAGDVDAASPLERLVTDTLDAEARDADDEEDEAESRGGAHVDPPHAAAPAVEAYNPGEVEGGVDDDAGDERPADDDVEAREDLVEGDNEGDAPAADGCDGGAAGDEEDEGGVEVEGDACAAGDGDEVAEDGGGRVGELAEGAVEEEEHVRVHVEEEEGEGEGVGLEEDFERCGGVGTGGLGN